MHTTKSRFKAKIKYLGPFKVINIKINDTYDVQKIEFTKGFNDHQYMPSS